MGFFIGWKKKNTDCLNMIGEKLIGYRMAIKNWKAMSPSFSHPLEYYWLLIVKIIWCNPKGYSLYYACIYRIKTRNLPLLWSPMANSTANSILLIEKVLKLMIVQWPKYNPRRKLKLGVVLIHVNNNKTKNRSLLEGNGVVKKNDPFGNLPFL